MDGRLKGRPKGSRNKSLPKGWIPNGVSMQKYDWTIVGQEFSVEKSRLFYLVKCKCGNDGRVTADSVIRGTSRGCNECAKRKSGDTRREPSSTTKSMSLQK